MEERTTTTTTRHQRPKQQERKRLLGSAVIGVFVFSSVLIVTQLQYSNQWIYGKCQEQSSVDLDAPRIRIPGDKSGSRSSDDYRHDHATKEEDELNSIKLSQQQQPPRRSTFRTEMPRTLVIYFPQYHKEPINDKNWGENFTDWESLKQTPEQNRLNQTIPRPLLLPSNESTSNRPPPLGYYDLTHKEPRETQGILAKQYGIDGFIYHHYWFYDPTHPGPSLEKPLERMLQDGHPDVPFLLNWCAVKWVNVWMGKAIFQTIPTSKNKAITLQDQFFNATDDMIQDHYKWLSKFFSHPNYIHVDNKPAFLVYSYNDMALPILEKLQAFAQQDDGLEGIHFIVGRSSHHEDLYDTSHTTNLTKANFYFKRKRQSRASVDPTQTATKVRSIQDDVNTTVPQFQFPNNDPPKRGISPRTWKYNPFAQSMTYPYPLDILTSKPYAVPPWCRRPSSSIPINATNTVPHVTNDTHPEIIGIVTTFDNTPRRKYKESTIWNGHETPDQAIERFAASYQASLYYLKCCVIGGGDGGDRFVAVVRFMSLHLYL